jgi:hypothetical protein
LFQVANVGSTLATGSKRVGADFSQRSGVQTWLDVADEYGRHIPVSSLMTEDVIGALAGSPVIGAGSTR